MNAKFRVRQRFRASQCLPYNKKQLSSSYCFLFYNMGNICNYLCPQNFNRFISTSELNASYYDSDVKGLCTNEVTPASTVNEHNDLDEHKTTSVFKELIPKHELESNDSARNQSNALSKTVSYSLQGPKVIREYVNFPFLIDNEIGNWIVKSRFMFILRGPPGSGKSFLSGCIKTRFPMAKICSADDFWYLESNGFEYQFDINRLNEAHEWCHNSAYNAACFGHSPIVIDNTNTRSWETRYYTDLARRFHYFVIMVIPQTPWRFDAETLSMRNVHFVSLDTIEAKVRNFEHIYPLYYGWFWSTPPNSAYSEHYTLNRSLHGTTKSERRCKSSIYSNPSIEVNRLLRWAWDALNTIIELPGVRNELVNAFDLPQDATIQDVLTHWESATVPNFGTGLKACSTPSIPHITAMYSKYGRAFGAEYYALRRSVNETLLGKLFTVQITGLVISPRTIGARVKLPNDEVIRHLWASDDQEVVFPGNCGIIHVSRPIGCRAHVTIAVAPGVSPVETGRDLLRVVDMELNNQPGDHVAIIKNGSVRRLVIPKLSSNTSPEHCLAQVTTENSNYHLCNSNDHNMNHVYADCGSQISLSDHEAIYVYDLDFPHQYRVTFAASY
ncbi:2',3'-cyclic-nucleotide 3'-phosphodiesterase [Schistosoma japonicum]|nr:2',3'-cyclic-nucleotide 3'-phosphodiesterase [Schistosoma japonicum]